MGQVPQREGQKLYAVPSQHEANVRYLADTRSCTCPDFQRWQQACKHVLVIRRCAAAFASGDQRRRHRADR